MTPENGDTADHPDENDAANFVENDEAQSTDAQSTEAQSTEDADAGTGRSWKRYARIGSIAAIYLAAFGLAGILGWKYWEQHTLDNAAQDAQQTAINYAQVLTSIDSNNLDENFAAVLNGATGDFKDMYTRDSMELRQLLVENKATAHGVVIDSAIQSESKDKVTVLLLVDQTVTNTARPDARSDSSRMKITMEKVDNRWLASTVELP
ncbi:MAG: Mce protein [Actinomycetia bacterium]|nr:Mce protein [Actinomycetes bacterium]MCH9710569.1 Mce protein [Actinomycetes bacterium]MCH9768488.1 Mce protein [Actinomycetes bacterium]